MNAAFSSIRFLLFVSLQEETFTSIFFSSSLLFLFSYSSSFRRDLIRHLSFPIFVIFLITLLNITKNQAT